MYKIAPASNSSWAGSFGRRASPSVGSLGSAALQTRAATAGLSQ
jgi:hypothetical protein